MNNLTTTSSRDGEQYHVDNIIIRMCSTGRFCVQRQKRLRRALWESTERGYAPVTVERMVAWLHEHYAGYSTSERDFVRLAEAIIAEFRYHDFGVPLMSDEMEFT